MLDAHTHSGPGSVLRSPRMLCRALILLCTLAILAGPRGTSLVLYTCGYDRVTRISCCCRAPAPSGPALRAPRRACCETSEVPTQPPSVTSSAPDPLLAASVPSTEELPSGTERGDSRPPRSATATGPPDLPAPPVYTLTCTYLI